LKDSVFKSTSMGLILLALRYTPELFDATSVQWFSVMSVKHLFTVPHHKCRLVSSLIFGNMTGCLRVPQYIRLPRCFQACFLSHLIEEPIKGIAIARTEWADLLLPRLKPLVFSGDLLTKKPRDGMSHLPLRCGKRVAHSDPELDERYPDTSLETEALAVSGAGFRWAPLREGGTAYGNRNYVWREIPERFRGWTYTRTGGGERARIKVRALKDTVVFVVTAPGQKGTNKEHWEPVEDAVFHYTNRNRTSMQVFRRSLQKGRELVLPQTNWTGTLLLLPVTAMKE
jgi:hypothetical protein